MTTQIASTPQQPITNKDVLFFIRDQGFANIPEMARHFEADGERLVELTATVEALVAVGQIKRENPPHSFRRDCFRVKITTETVRLAIAAKGTLTEQEIVTLFLPQEMSGEKGVVRSMVHSALCALIVPTRIQREDGRWIIRPVRVVYTTRHRQPTLYGAVQEPTAVTEPEPSIDPQVV